MIIFKKNNCNYLSYFNFAGTRKGDESKKSQRKEQEQESEQEEQESEQEQEEELEKPSHKRRKKGLCYIMLYYINYW